MRENRGAWENVKFELELFLRNEFSLSRFLFCCYDNKYKWWRGSMVFSWLCSVHNFVITVPGQRQKSERAPSRWNVKAERAKLVFCIFLLHNFWQRRARRKKPSWIMKESAFAVVNSVITGSAHGAFCFPFERLFVVAFSRSVNFSSFDVFIRSTRSCDHYMEIDFFSSRSVWGYFFDANESKVYHFPIITLQLNSPTPILLSFTVFESRKSNFSFDAFDGTEKLSKKRMEANE